MKTTTLTPQQLFLVLSTLLCFTRAADLLTTYWVTPDLSLEKNPLVAIFGFGWSAMIIVQALALLILIPLTYWEIFYSKPAYPAQGGLSFAEFAPLYYFGRRRPWTDFLWRLPQSWPLILRLNGYVLPRLLILVGFYVATSSFLLVYSALWRQFFGWAFPYVYIIPLLLILAFTTYSFLRREFRLYGENHKYLFMPT